jgi:hypothetical protein
VTDQADFVGQAHNLSPPQVDEIGMLAARFFDDCFNRSETAFIKIVVTKDKVDWAWKSRQETQGIFNPQGIGNVAGHEEGIGLISRNFGNKGSYHLVGGKFEVRIADPDEFHVINGAWMMLVLE